MFQSAVELCNICEDPKCLKVLQCVAYRKHFFQQVEDSVSSFGALDSVISIPSSLPPPPSFATDFILDCDGCLFPLFCCKITSLGSGLHLRAGCQIQWKNFDVSTL